MEKLSLLILEDEVFDAELIIKTLERSGMNFEAIIVSDKEEFLYIIRNKQFDAILADNSLPQFNAMKALQLAKENKLHIPFILVTGAVSEEYAVDIMKAGASDYILKDRLQRLSNAIMSAIDKYNLEAERQKYLEGIIKSEILMKEAEQLAHFGSWESDLVNHTDHWSDEQYRILGYTPGEIAPSINNFLDRIHPDDFLYVKEIFEDTIKGLARKEYDCKITCKNGTIKHIHSELMINRDEQGTVTRINGFINDVTGTRIAELRIMESEKRYRELFEKNPLPLWVIDPVTYQFIDVNEAAIRHYGYSYDEFLAMVSVDIMSPEEKERFLGMNVISGDSFSSRGIWKHVKKDGTVIQTELNVNELTFNGEKALLVLAKDVTE